MQDMLHEMMQQMFANMTPDEKIEMMMGIMNKMKEGPSKEETAPETGAKKGPGGMKEAMSKMMQGGDGQKSMMPEMMLKGMMPHCIKMMMPAISKDKRADLVSDMIGTLMEQGSSGMSADEKAAFVAKVAETIKA